MVPRIHRRGSTHPPEAGLRTDLTPMIDVVLLLVIFFVMITDLTQRELEELDLPVASAATPDDPRAGARPLVVHLSADGSYSVEGSIVDADELERRFALRREGRPVRFRANGTAPFAPIAAGMRRLAVRQPKRSGMASWKPTAPSTRNWRRS